MLTITRRITLHMALWESKFTLLLYLFLWLCVWCGSNIMISQLFNIYLGWAASITNMQSMLCANNRVFHVLNFVFVCYLLHTNLIFCIRLCANHTVIFAHIYLKYWTSKMLVRYILSSVWLKLNTFSRLYFIQLMRLRDYWGDDFENMCTLSNYHNQIRTTNW